MSVVLSSAEMRQGYEAGHPHPSSVEVNAWSYTSATHTPLWRFAKLITLYFLILLEPTQLTHSWSWSFLEKQQIVQLLKNFPVFDGTRRFITSFTRALPLVPTLSQIDSDHTTLPYLSKIHFNIVHPPTSWSS
jgi:hypothetical protein